jgi:[ribosomal protein S18]-alanine N-acetyltransferase
LIRVTEIEDLSFDDPYPYRLFQAFLIDLPEGFRVAAVGDRLVGYCILSNSGDPQSLMISSIAIHPDFRKQGTGEMLLADSIRIAEKLSVLRSIKRIVLQVASTNAPAQALYHKFGFRSVGTLRDYYGKNKDGIQMQLDLEKSGR